MIVNAVVVPVIGPVVLRPPISSGPVDAPVVPVVVDVDVVADVDVVVVPAGAVGTVAIAADDWAVAWPPLLATAALAGTTRAIAPATNDGPVRANSVRTQPREPRPLDAAARSGGRGASEARRA